MTRPLSPRLAVLLLIIAGLVAYANSYPKAFVFDDEDWIVFTPHGNDLGAYLASYPTRPLLMLSNWLIGRVRPLDPVPHHVLNVAIHVAAGITLFGLVWRTLRLPLFHGRYRSSATRYGFAVALLWLVHPIQTQAVTYIIQRGESLAGLCYLGILYALLRSHTSWHHPRAWLCVSLTCLVLGFCSKEILMTAPGAVLLFDRVFLARSMREMLGRRWGYYLVFLAIWAGFVSWHLSRALAIDKGIGFGMEAVGPKQYALTECGVLLHYLRLCVWPVGQAIDYQWPWCRTVSEAMPALAVVFALLLGTVVLLWRRPAAGFVAAWFFLILIPTSSFLPIIDPIFEHRLYLSLAGVVIFGVWLGDWALGERPKAKTLILLLVAGALTGLTLRRNEDYRSSLTLWQNALDQHPHNRRAAFNVAIALINENRPAEAIPLLEARLAEEPTESFVRENVIFAYEQAGQFAEAERHARELTRRWPSDAGYREQAERLAGKNQR